MSLSGVVKSIQDIMRQDAGVDGDAQRISQLVWMLFLKIYDAKESDWEVMDSMDGKTYVSVIPNELRWRSWAEDKEGLTGNDLIEFINGKLFPKLKDIEIQEGMDERGVIVKYLFEDTYNYMKSGYLMRQVIDKINEIDFESYEERHAFNDIYESILKDLQNAGNAGEFYTPRPVTQFIVDMVNPNLGESVADFACGTGGFLICALNNLYSQLKGDKNTPENINLIHRSIHGIEKKPLPHMLAVTNMVLNDVDVPDIKHDNAFTMKHLRDYDESDMYNCITMNPPFGGTEEDVILTYFPANFRTKETADLFLVMIMHRLKDNGRAGVVLPDGFLFGEGVKTNIKEKLLSEFNLHTIVRLPNGVFNPYTGINTNLLFFDNTGPTKDIWYFEHPLPEGYKNYTKTKPIKISEFDLEKAWWNDRENEEFSSCSWKVSANEIIKRNYNLDIKNPNNLEEIVEKSSKELLEQLKNSNEITNKLINEIEKGLFNE
ncbi:type I restriction enzyme M protein [Methanococcus maripaludis]|uniref:site-specific DNA-methyltransferase (adenine-specific) n=1 Tax=Methanococcus maripaludis TaxID=39152 RepID=A0A7J9S499_METMI|nr:class I SAM-dependent DNA methyltransferase [Methanococcus maripaludis]MBB6401592.1 type I restriction enzyme M protein [Methanococcus maripaludis]